MRTGMSPPAAQWGRRLAAVGAVAIVLAGTAAAPAAARTKVPRSGVAHSLYYMCAGVGGDPFYFEYMGVWGVGCDYHDGEDPVVWGKGDD